jgi:hypothetical protein
MPVKNNNVIENKYMQTTRKYNADKDANKLYLTGYEIKKNNHKFIVARKESDKLITISFDDKTHEIKCNCSDYKFRCYKNNIICKHCIFMLENVLKINIEEYIEGRIVTKYDDCKEKISKIKLFVQPIEKSIFSVTEVTKDDDCPICFLEIDGKNDLNNIVSCPTCHNYVHKDCIIIWLKHAVVKSCVFCRSIEWKKMELK